MEYIKQDIENQILITNRAFTNRLGRLQFEGLLSEDVDILSKILKNVSRAFKVSNVISIVLSTFMAVVSLLRYMDIIESVNLNKGAILIIFTITFLVQTFNCYKVKVNLENKIFLLGLLKKIERK